MNILLTGATGFLGSNFLRWWRTCSRADNLVLLTSRDVDGFPCVLHKGFSFESGDFLSAGIEAIDAVILLGAYVEHGKEPGIVRKHISSLNNIDYTLNHLPNIPQKVVYCSSIAVYGFDASVPYTGQTPLHTEESPLLPSRKAYALSKCMGERLVQEWCSENDCACQVLRLGAVFGPGRRFADFLGSAVAAAKEGKTFSMYAPIDQRWNYVYIEDICRWLLAAVKLTEQPGIINLTSSANYTSVEVLEKVKEAVPTFQWAPKKEIEPRGVDKAFDSTKRERYLGMEEWSLAAGLKKVCMNPGADG